MPANSFASTYLHQVVTYSGLILGLRPANERCRYKVMASLIGWAITWNQPWYWVASYPFSKGFMSSWLKSCENLPNFNKDLSIHFAHSNDSIKPQICMSRHLNCYGMCKIVTFSDHNFPCSDLHFDIRIGLWAHKPTVKWVPSYQQTWYSLQLHHNKHDGISNHRPPHDCLLKRLFRRRSKKTLKLHITGLCEGNSPVTGEFPTQRASNAEMFPFDDVILWLCKIKPCVYFMRHTAHLIGRSSWVRVQPEMSYFPENFDCFKNNAKAVAWLPLHMLTFTNKISKTVFIWGSFKFKCHKSQCQSKQASVKCRTCGA